MLGVGNALGVMLGVGNALGVMLGVRDALGVMRGSFDGSLSTANSLTLLTRFGLQEPDVQGWELDAPVQFDIS